MCSSSSRVNFLVELLLVFRQRHSVTHLLSTLFLRMYFTERRPILSDPESAIGQIHQFAALLLFSLVIALWLFQLLLFAVVFSSCYLMQYIIVDTHLRRRYFTFSFYWEREKKFLTLRRKENAKKVSEIRLSISFWTCVRSRVIREFSCSRRS